MIVTVYIISYLFRFMYLLPPKSRGFWTLLVSVSNLLLASSTWENTCLPQIWPPQVPCGCRAAAVKAWVEPFLVLGAGCWLLVEAQLIPSSKMTSIHLYICDFFPLGFRVPLRQRRLAPCDPLTLPQVSNETPRV